PVAVSRTSAGSAGALIVSASSTTELVPSAVNRWSAHGSCSCTSTRLPDASRIGGSSRWSDARTSSRNVVVGSSSSSCSGRGRTSRPSPPKPRPLCAGPAPVPCVPSLSAPSPPAHQCPFFGDDGDEIFMFVGLHLGRGQDHHGVVDQALDRSLGYRGFC